MSAISCFECGAVLTHRTVNSVNIVDRQAFRQVIAVYAGKNEHEGSETIVHIPVCYRCLEDNKFEKIAERDKDGYFRSLGVPSTSVLDRITEEVIRE